MVKKIKKKKIGETWWNQTFDFLQVKAYCYHKYWTCWNPPNENLWTHEQLRNVVNHLIQLNELINLNL